MHFVVIGTNHKYSKIELREKLFFPKKRLKEALLSLKEESLLKAAVILSTCNRVEIYVNTEEPKKTIAVIKNFISEFFKISLQAFSPYLYIYKGKKAVEHLFLVSCGLDSLILGESEVLGQVQSAFIESEKTSFSNEILRKIFCCALYFARRIHAETSISEGKISVGSIAVDFIKEKVGVLADKNILIIGVGKVTELVLQYLRKEASSIVFIANRNFEKANELAAKIGASAVRFEELKYFLRNADIVISATKSPHFIIKKETLEGNLTRKLFIIDLAVPRDVEPSVKTVKGVELLCMEDMGGVIKKNVNKRYRKVKEIKKIIAYEAENVWRKITESEHEPALLP